MSSSGGRWCTHADALLGVEGIHVRSVAATEAGLLLTSRPILSSPVALIAESSLLALDTRTGSIPFVCFGRPVRLPWAKRIWRCAGPERPRTAFTEEHPLARRRAKLAARAVAWATDALQRFDTSVSAQTHQLGVAWYTAWDAIKSKVARGTATVSRLAGVNAWASMTLSAPTPVHGHPAGPPAPWTTPATRRAGCMPRCWALSGRSGHAYAAWLKERGWGIHLAA